MKLFVICLSSVTGRPRQHKTRTHFLRGKPNAGGQAACREPLASWYRGPRWHLSAGGGPLIPSGAAGGVREESLRLRPRSVQVHLAFLLPLHPRIGADGVVHHEVVQDSDPGVVVGQVVVVLGRYLPHLEGETRRVSEGAPRGLVKMTDGRVTDPGRP